MSLIVPIQFSHYLTEIGPVDWEVLLERWRDSEDDDFHQMHIDLGNHQDWDDWRNEMIKNLDLENLSWFEYEIDSIEACLPNFRGGPFAAWMSRYYQNESMALLQEIIIPNHIDREKRDTFLQNANNEVQNFIGLLHGQDIVLVDGLHRSNAIVQELKAGKKVNCKIKIALAKSRKSVLPIIGVEHDSSVEI